jgi:hypothetical protein
MSATSMAQSPERPEAVAGAATRFVILNAPRTGSNFLCTVLNSHPDILCHHEIFNPHVIGVARHLQNGDFRLGTMAERAADPLEFLQRVWHANLGRAAVGFKLCLWQHEAAYRAVMADGTVRKIILKRRNRVKTFVSLLLARQTGEWVVYDDTVAPTARPRIRVDPAELVENVAQHQAYYDATERSLRDTQQAFVTLWYEDLLADTALDGALALIGIAGRPHLPAGQTWKLTPTALRDVVANFAELAAALAGTGLEVEMHDDGL